MFLRARLSRRSKKNSSSTTPLLSETCDGNRGVALIDIQKMGVSAGESTLLLPLTVSVDAGEALVVRGKNGVGKTTLLRVLAGVHSPSTGAVRIAGEPVDRRDSTFRRRVAAMIGLPPMALDLTVHDHVAMIAATWFRSAEAVDQSIGAVLAELGLTRLSNRFPHELSSGETQLFALALVLVRPFDVLILDEPEQRLDPDKIELLVTALNTRRSNGATLIVSTHSTALADRLGGHTLDMVNAS